MYNKSQQLLDSMCGTSKCWETRTIPFWLTIKDIEVLDQRRYMYASQSTYRMVGFLNIRMVDPFLQDLSYQLMAYRRLPAAQQLRVRNALFHGKREHLEACIARPCHDLHLNAAELHANHLLHQDLQSIGKATPSHNISSE